MPVRYNDYGGYNKKNRMSPLIPFAAISTDVLETVTLGFGIYSTMGVGFSFDGEPDHPVL